MAGIDNNTVLYLRGDSFKDLSPNPKTVANNGVTLANDGIFGKCFEFGPSKPYMSISNLSLKGNYTIEFWMYNKGITNYWQRQIETNNNALIITHMGGERAIKVLINDSIELISPNNSAPVGEWLHIALVKSGSNKTNLYINGILKASNSASYSLSFSALNVGAKSGTDYINGFIDEVSVSNIARYAEDFTPPTQPYNSITINKTNQTDTNIEFNIEKLGQETINKVEVLVNGTVSETYIDNYDNLSYAVDKELCVIGNNYITIRVTYDDNYTEEEVITYKHTVPPLPQEAPLLDTVERVKLLTKSKQNEKTMLSSILTSKNVEVSEEDKMSDLIDKVDLLGEYNDGKLWLYEDGDECISVTGGFVKGGYHRGTVAGNEKLSDRIRFYTGTASSVGDTSTLMTNNTINFNEYSTLKVECTYNPVPSGHSIFNFGVINSKQIVSSEPSYMARIVQRDSISNKSVLEVDVSNLTINGYISLTLDSWKPSTSAELFIYKLWLEK